MAKSDVISEYLAEIGGRGGRAKVPKGTAALSPEERTKRGKAAAAVRWGAKAKAAKKKATK